MPEFLALLPPADALALLMKNLPGRVVESDEVLSRDAIGRVIVDAVLAPEPLPAFDRSTVDGYAVRAADTFGASESLPAFLTVTGEAPMGRAPEMVVGVGQAVLIHTGGMLPAGADGVVMLEHTQEARPGEIEVLRAIAPGENLLLQGEDVQVGDEVIAAGARLRPAEIGGLHALGIETVRVARRPRIGILSTGDEVVPLGTRPGPGQVRDINSYSLGALVAEHGGEAVGYGILPDNDAALEAALRAALAECDGVIVTAGSSASARDLTAGVIDRMGRPGVLAHGVNVRPGKPTILAVCDGKPVIGLPGNPVSALVIAQLFVAPVVERLAGSRESRGRGRARGRVTVNLASQAGREDYLPARLVDGPDGLAVEPVFFKSNLIFNLVKADGLLHIPADATGVSAGEWVDVILL
jgi:molybdopterin molybdotransferase